MWSKKGSIWSRVLWKLRQHPRDADGMKGPAGAAG